jgi:hypothetical protein
VQPQQLEARKRKVHKLEEKRKKKVVVLQERNENHFNPRAIN